MTATTLRDRVRDTHPHRRMESLDAATLSDLFLVSPTVIIEVVGAREGIDALTRVRRIAVDAPLAAVRVAPADLEPDHVERTPIARFIALAVASLAFVAAVVASARTSAAIGATVSVVLIVSAPILSVAAVRAVQHARRGPVDRRRHFERRRSVTVIAVGSIDARSAARLATSVRRELEVAHTGNARYDVSVFDPRPGGSPD